MLSKEDNELLTDTNPGTPMGELFRRFWLPVALDSELPTPDGMPIRVKVLGEELVAFRDTSGRVGLVDAYCAHRGAPLFFGRNEQAACAAYITVGSMTPTAIASTSPMRRKAPA